MQNNLINWQPTASINNIIKRAELLKKIRAFFDERNITEVETPLLCNATITNPYIESITATTANHKTYYLQTSPEYSIKRLLASGIGDCYQICKAFREDECGKMHNPEFTIMEWYRMGYDHHQLMAEMDELLQTVIQTKPAIKISYQHLFLEHLNIDPFKASIADLKQIAANNNLDITESLDNADLDTWLNLLLSHIIEPKLGFDAPEFIYDYPASQAALAKINKSSYNNYDNNAGHRSSNNFENNAGYSSSNNSESHPNNHFVGERFEVYINGVELANGFHELTDAKEQRARFEQDNLERKKLGLKSMPIDENFLAALEHDLPDCSGVAVGIDRLLMLYANAKSIDEVLCFTTDRA